MRVPINLIYQTVLWTGLAGIPMFFSIQLILRKYKWKQALSQATLWALAYGTMYLILRIVETFQLHDYRLPRIGYV